MFQFAFAEPFGPDSMVDILNRATSYYLAAIAVAIGFRMGLFNIGVDGQYRLATLLAGALGAASFVLAAGSAADRADHRGGDGGRRRLGWHRRAAEGLPRRQRGHLDDHAELRRRRRCSPTC